MGYQCLKRYSFFSIIISLLIISFISPKEIFAECGQDHGAPKTQEKGGGAGGGVSVNLDLTDIFNRVLHKKKGDISVPPGEPVILGVLLERADNNWIPREASDTKLIASIYRWDPGSAEWAFPGLPRKITIEFLFRSSENGLCMNVKSALKNLPDVHFNARFNPGFNCSDDHTGNGRWFRKATTKSPVVSATAVVLCEDYGAYSIAFATADDCVQLKRLPNGKVTKAALPSDANVDLPRDDNGNNISDAWEDKQPDRALAKNAADDLDPDPVGNGVPGDGLSAYEEYRGFFVQGRHVRTRWSKKTLFIHDRDKMGLGKFPQASNIECYSIKEEEYSDSRVVNMNSGNANLGQQHGLLLINSPLGGSASGRTSAFGPPKNVAKVRVDRAQHFAYVPPSTARTETIKRLQESQMRDFNETITHELGHATGLRHHGDLSFGDGSTKIIYPSAPESGSSEGEDSNFVKAIGKAINKIAKEAGKFVDNLLTTRYREKTLCSIILPHGFFVGKKGNRKSGDIGCFMRYTHQMDSVYPAGEDYECVQPRDLHSDDYFCESAQGTGFNAGGRCAGNAQKGDCKHQFIINDIKG